MTQVELSNLNCVFRSQQHGCDIIKFSSNHPEKLCPGPAPASFTQQFVSHLMLLTGAGGWCSCTWPDLSRSCWLFSPLLPQFTERPFTQGFHITELMIKGMPLLLPCPSCQHHFQVTALSHGAPRLLLQTSRKLSRNFYLSLVTGRKTLPS